MSVPTTALISGLFTSSTLESPTGSVCYAPEHHGRCCCNCRYHLRDHSHPLTDGGRITAQRGWLCNPPELDAYFSGWPEHGMCEMHDNPAPHPPLKGPSK
jgi:hypothetical protein